MPDLTSPRLAAAGAVVGGAAFAVAGALQATGLDWKENAVETPAPARDDGAHRSRARRGRSRRRRARPARRRPPPPGWIAIAAGQVAIAAASTVSNIRGVDAAWFPAVAVAANLLWILGTFALAFAL